MKLWHPLHLLAPHFALAAFAASGILGWRAHTAPLPLVLRCLASFFLTYYLVRACGSLLTSSAPRQHPNQEQK